MKDDQWFKNQAWLEKQASSLSDSDRVIRTSTITLGTPGTDFEVQYNYSLDIPPALTPMVSVPYKSRYPPLIALEFQAYLTNDAAGEQIASLGFLSAGLGTLAGTLLSSTGNELGSFPSSLGSLSALPPGPVLPNLFKTSFDVAGLSHWQDFVTAESYLPSPVSVDGTDTQLWTQQNIDSMTMIVPVSPSPVPCAQVNTQSLAGTGGGGNYTITFRWAWNST